MNIPSTIFDRGLEEVCEIRRQDPEDSTNMTVISSNVKIIIQEAEQDDYILPTGEPLSSHDYDGFIINPETIFDSIEKEDIVFRTEKNNETKFPRLFITDIQLLSGPLYLKLEQPQR